MKPYLSVKVEPWITNVVIMEGHSSRPLCVSLRLKTLVRRDTG